MRIAGARVAEADELEQVVDALPPVGRSLPRMRSPNSTFCAAVMFGKSE